MVGEVALDRLQLGDARFRGRLIVAVASAPCADIIESVASLNRGSVLGLPKPEKGTLTESERSGRDCLGAMPVCPGESALPRHS